MVQRSDGTLDSKESAPGKGTMPSRSSISRRSTSRFSASWSEPGRYSRMVIRLGRPCARATTCSGLNPCSAAHWRHTLATAGGELMSTPSRSNNSAAHCNRVIFIDYRSGVETHARVIGFGVSFSGLRCTMLSKCANPDCNAKFLFLHQGKLFQLSPTREIRKASPHIARSLLERFWLCDRCSQTMTIIWRDTHAEVVPLPKKPRKVGAEGLEQRPEQTPQKRAARTGTETV